MKSRGACLGGITRFFLNPRPSLFDLCACLGVVGMGFMMPDLRGLYLVFYAFFLFSISLSTESRRSGASAGLTLICLVGFTNLFVHSMNIYRSSITFAYLNVYLMMEGFMYLVAGSMIFTLISTKATNVRLFAVTLPIAALGWVKYAVKGGQMSVLLALGVCFVVYLAYKRRFLILGVIASMVLCLFLFARLGDGRLDLIAWLKMKFALRPVVWLELCRIIKDHPFVGSGFNKFIGMDDNGIVIWNSTKTVVLNCLYRQNDYLNIASIYGLPILAGIAVFLKEGISRLYRTWMIVPFAAICIVCFVQMTMFQADKALIVLCGVAAFYTET